MITADQLKDIKERTAALKQYLAIDEKIIQVEEEQLRTQAPGFWDNAKEAEAQMKKVKGLQAWIDGYKEVNNRTEETEMALELFREEMVEESEVDDAYAYVHALGRGQQLQDSSCQLAGGRRRRYQDCYT